MGETLWLPREHDLLEREWASKPVLGLLEAQPYGHLRKISNHITAKYQEAFSQPFAPETEAEFEKRKARLSTRPARDKQVRHPGETEDAYKKRIHNISDVSVLMGTELA